jgi:hypothetical protein
MLTTAQRERIVSHLQRGWKLPDSLLVELWEAYEALEQAQMRVDMHPETDAGQLQSSFERSDQGRRQASFDRSDVGDARCQ